MSQNHPATCMYKLHHWWRNGDVIITVSTNCVVFSVTGTEHSGVSAGLGQLQWLALVVTSWVPAFPCSASWHPLRWTRQSAAEHKGQQAHPWPRGQHRHQRYHRQRSAGKHVHVHLCKYMASHLFLKALKGVWHLWPPAKHPVVNHCNCTSSCVSQKILLLHLRTEGNLQMSYMWNNVLLAKWVHDAEKTKCKTDFKNKDTN